MSKVPDERERPLILRQNSEDRVEVVCRDCQTLLGVVNSTRAAVCRTGEWARHECDGTQEHETLNGPN
jgi:hypothetical protein